MTFSDFPTGLPLVTSDSLPITTPLPFPTPRQWVRVGKRTHINMHDKRNLKYVGANNQESERRFLFYLILLSYLYIDSFFPGEIEFCKIWLQCQFVVLWNHVCGKSLEVFLCRSHSYRSSAKTDRRGHKQQQPSSHKSRRSKCSKRKYVGGIIVRVK